MELYTVIAFIVVILFLVVALFQILLVIGCPLGEFALGGMYKVLPMKLRFISGINALVLLVMCGVFAAYTGLWSVSSSINFHMMASIITGFLVLNTIANLFSRSKKEKYVMTPLSGVMFLFCLYLVLFT
ncbi:hypothetical protein [Oceanobacillus kimchii]|uniref:hypothetical protein n=1 Tax=Oceanobacillus kimchii TaxID=746691 RepID=UPI0009845C36|nr:hypothetical protein [Oceanobacillus kimchii]